MSTSPNRIEAFDAVDDELLTAATAQKYREWLDTREWLPEIGLSREAWDVHGVYVPEGHIDIPAESERLKKTMDTVGNVTIFLSEGAGLDSIVEDTLRVLSTTTNGYTIKWDGQRLKQSRQILGPQSAAPPAP